ncbi:response regulator transcription factor [Streptomyces xantholiticus]|uniref:response regulator transcription factor n=1 Tax=Streptomyces xantholiticus TaxID=68285 RepID=UPI0019C576AA|nr:response regulator transcription factor [Streptomyces xantholiticus]GGW61755.1 DNA-binding response regulator [Streptomyces xantholiticus]
MNSNGTIHILVADDHVLLREALCDVLEINPDFKVVAQCGDAEQAVARSAEERPDVAVLDVEMPGNDSVATIRRMRAVSPDTRIVILTMHADHRLVQQLFREGIRGFLHKSISRHALTSAIRSIHADPDRVVLSMAKEHLGLDVPPVAATLSDREVEILSLVATAMTNRQIASRLAIAEGTVKLHLHNVFRKLNAVSRIDAVNKASAASLIDWPATSRGAAR